MADTKISALTALAGANTASGDLFGLVDVSDTTLGAGGTNKKITRDELKAGLLVPRRYCRLGLNANQSISNTTVTAISWTVELSDPDNIITVPQAYVVVPSGLGITQARVEGCLCFAGGTTGGRMVQVSRQNSSGVDQENLFEAFLPGAGSATRLPIASGWFDTTGGERIVVNGYQESGGALNAVGSTTLTNARTQAFFEFR